jgi:FtsH-binding integral membrane protein
MLNKVSKFIFGVIVGITLLMNPVFASAQTTNQSECERLKSMLGGQSTSLPAYCDEAQVYNRITFWLYYIIGLAAVVSLIYGGYLYMTSRDNEAQLKKAKRLITWTIVGIILALLATVIVGIVVNLIINNTLV